VLAALCAVAASVLFAIGSTQQRRAAARVPRVAGGAVRLLLRLLRSRRWLFGTGFATAGLAMQAVALSRGSLVVVQGVIAAGLMVAIALEAHAEQRRPATGELAGALVLVGGVVMLVWAGPSGGHAPGVYSSIAAAALALLAGGGALLAARRPHAGLWTARALGSASGICFAVDAVFLKAIAETVPSVVSAQALATAAFFLGVGGFAATSALGNLAIQRGYQMAPLRVVQPALTGTEPIAAYLIGIVILDEVPRSGLGQVVLPAGVLVTVIGLVVVATANARPRPARDVKPLTCD
jgi:drug/metabolite transporter (DMT)-like permease